MPARAVKQARRFARIIVVDWSAASTRAPPRFSPDRCWLAWGDAAQRAAPEYFRTRDDCIARVTALLEACNGDALVGWDFPFGSPGDSRIGGGRPLAIRLSALISDRDDGRNNRFAVAAMLNRELGSPPGPFWFCPTREASAALTMRKPPFDTCPFAEMRIAERRLRERGRQPMSVWQLGGAGAVGSQMLLGLPRVLDLAEDARFRTRTRFWPFETVWDERLEGIVHAEVWPSLPAMTHYPYRIKDARQVATLRDVLLAANEAGTLPHLLARPDGLSPREAAACLAEEGWIVGVR
jgi:hypothetical protein